MPLTVDVEDQAGSAATLPPLHRQLGNENDKGKEKVVSAFQGLLICSHTVGFVEKKKIDARFC